MERAATQEPCGGAAEAGVAPAPAAPGPEHPAGRLRLRHPAALSELRAIRRRIERWASGHGFTEDELIDLQLAVGEAVSNGIEHGYRDRPSGPVEVELEIRPDDAEGSARRLLTARVRDHGRWRPAPARPGHRGRGLAMIRGLSVDMCVTSDARGTEVVFTVPLER
jgi:anti-sigma regulatory factor (Ser/Thr protein kinase)